MAQYFASHGYTVFRPNYRGSIGYGQALYTANRGRLGEIEFIDIESGVDALVAAGKAIEALVYRWLGVAPDRLDDRTTTATAPRYRRRCRGRRALVRAERHQPWRRRAVGIRRRSLAAARELRPRRPGSGHPRCRDADAPAARPR